ncbi:MAG: IS1595 family transposase [Micrococcaceae bacterium]
MSLDEFYQEFPTVSKALKYFEVVRFGGRPTDCLKCGAVNRVSVKTAGFYRCLEYKGTFSIRTGTMLESSHIPLNKWLLAMYLFTTSRKGISSIQLGKVLGITQKSSWFLLQRLRYACVSEFKTLLDGIVEVDEAFIGGKEKNRHKDKKRNNGRGGKVEKTSVVGFKQRNGKVKLQVVSDVSKPTLHKEIKKHVDYNATLMSDDWRGYLSAKGKVVKEHYVVNHSAREYVNGVVSTNEIESVWAIVKRGFYGVYHWFTSKHTQTYVNEVEYRFNQGRDDDLMSCQWQDDDFINNLAGEPAVKPQSKTISFVLSGQALEMLENAMNKTGFKSGKQAKELLIDRLFQEKYGQSN